MKEVSNKRLYVNPNSMEPILLEEKLVEAGIEFMCHDIGPTFGAPWEMTMPYAPQVEYTVFEDDYERAVAILDEIRANMSPAEGGTEGDE